MDWAQAIEKLENRIETLERNTRPYPVAIANQNAKLSNLMNTAQLMNTDIEAKRLRAELRVRMHELLTWNVISVRIIRQR